MPRGDGTGPAGMGSMTGRGAGYCGGSGEPGFASAGGGWGMGFRGGRGMRGGGHGWRHRFWATGLPGWARAGAFGGPGRGVDPAAWKDALERRAEMLRSEPESVTKRLSEIGNHPEPK